MKIYRTDDEAVKLIPTNLNTVVEFGKLHQDPEKREEMISQAFGSYIVTLGKWKNCIFDVISLSRLFVVKHAEGTGFSYRACKIDRFIYARWFTLLNSCFFLIIIWEKLTNEFIYIQSSWQYFLIYLSLFLLKTTSVGGFDFGERALITNEPRSATVMTVVPTDLLVVDREVFSRWAWVTHQTNVEIDFFYLIWRTLEAAHVKELQEKNDFINRCPLFCTWPERIKRLVSLNLERERYAYDSVLYRQGARADAIYFIWK